MRFADQGRTARRRLPYLALVLVALIATVGLSQCKLVDERLTGVANPFGLEPEKCMEQCAQDAAARLRAEAAVHSQDVKQCHGDPSCIALEQVRHQNVIRQITSDREACLNNCHHQGSGSGGR